MCPKPSSVASLVTDVSFDGVDLYSAQSKDEYLKLITEYVDAHPDEKVIRGIGWNPNIYGGYPTAEELDPTVSDRPAILLGFTIHDAWLNWSNKTSPMLEPYLAGEVEEETQKLSPTAYGVVSVDGERMKQVVLACNARGLDVNIHVDGSQTIRNKIDAIGASRVAGHTDARNQLPHLFWPQPDDQQRWT